MSAKDEHVGYQEFVPAPPLQDFIHCYWLLHAKTPLKEPFSYRVVSDGCVDIFYNLNKKEESFAMGFCGRYTEFSIGTEFAYGGIRFYPSIFPSLFGISAKKLTNGEQWLRSILPAIAEFISLHLSDDFPATIPKIDAWLMSMLQEHPPQIDDRFYKAFLEILTKKGCLEIEKELDTGLSVRQLRRFFDYYIGTSPKSFCQVVRFQSILHAELSSQGQTDKNVYLDLGFYDQAHFIKNFTRFYGISPRKAFR